MLTDGETGIGDGVAARGGATPEHALVRAPEHPQREHSLPKRLDPSA